MSGGHGTQPLTVSGWLQAIVTIYITKDMDYSCQGKRE